MQRLNWGMIGGGEGSQIGPAHRMSVCLDNTLSFVAGALDIDSEAGRNFAIKLGVAPERAYGCWREMLEGEINHPDRVDLVTIATPNNTHFEITKNFLEAGFNVLCEKPITMTVEEAEEIYHISKLSGKICAVNFGYTGYPLVRQMKSMVRKGELGHIRLILAEFSHGHHADVKDMDNPRVRWRYDPKKAGISAQFADCGIHALHMASFISGQEPISLSADFISTIEGRILEDDAMVNLRMNGGTTVRIWTSSIALGRQHGLTIQVFGENGGLRWSQEQPNQLYFQPLNKRLEIIERGEVNLSPEVEKSSRLTIGHTEGMISAFSNIYSELSRSINDLKEKKKPEKNTTLYPTVEDGVRSMAAIHQAKASAEQNGVWLDARPPMFRES